jgi:hypothetical protein
MEARFDLMVGFQVAQHVLNFESDGAADLKKWDVTAGHPIFHRPLLHLKIIGQLVL